MKAIVVALTVTVSMTLSGCANNSPKDSYESTGVTVDALMSAARDTGLACGPAESFGDTNSTGVEVTTWSCERSGDTYPDWQIILAEGPGVADLSLQQACGDEAVVDRRLSMIHTRDLWIANTAGIVFTKPVTAAQIADINAQSSEVLTQLAEALGTSVTSFQEQCPVAQKSVS